MDDLAGVLTALGGAVAAVIGALALVLRQVRINNRATRRELELLWELVELLVRKDRTVTLALADAPGVALPADVEALDKAIRAKRDQLNADLLATSTEEAAA